MGSPAGQAGPSRETGGAMGRIASALAAAAALAAAVGIAAAAHAAPKEFKDCATCPEMVVVPAGSFTMGSPATEIGRDSDEGQHKVTIPKTFAVGKYPITWD